MGTAPIKDVMLSFQATGGIDAPGKQDGKGGMFMDVLNGAVAKNGLAQANQSDPSTVRQADGNRMGIKKAQTAESRGIKNDDAKQKPAEVTDVKDKRPDDEKVGKALEDKASKVMDAIKDELSVSDEELEEAMASMGLSPLDLLDEGNLKDLMIDLAGEEDALALVTNGDLLASINSVTETALAALDELNEEFGITAGEINEILEAMKENEPEVIGTAQDGPFDSIPEDDEKEDDRALGDNKGIRVEINREGSSGDPIIRETSTENATMQRRVSQMMDDRKQDGQMQEAMPGQSFVENLQGDQAAAVTAAGDGTQPYVDARSIMEQVTDRIKVNITEDSTTMELQLHPASLGTVNLSVATSGGVVTANILVQNEAVKAVLEGQLTQLLQTFEEQGQRVEAIEVAVAGYDLDRSLNQGNERGSEGGQERRSEGIGRTARRRLNLNDLTEEELEELTEEEQLAAEMMEANGTSVDFTA